MRAGKLGLDILDRLLAGLLRKICRNTLAERGALSAGIWIGGVGRDRRIYRDVLQLMHERLLVGARAVLNRDRCVHARNRRASRRIGAHFSGVPGHGVCGGPGYQACRRIECRSSDPQRRRVSRHRGAEAKRRERSGVRTRDRQIGAVAAMQRDRSAVDGRGICGARDRIDFCQQRLNAVGDVELVTGRAGGHECDRRAVDGDGVAGPEVCGQRIRCSGAGQQRCAGNGRRGRGLVVDHASRDRCRRIEEIIRRRDRGRRDQRCVAERLYRRGQRGLQVQRRRGRIDADRKRARGRRRCRRRRQFDRLRGAVGKIENEFDLVAVIGIDAAEIHRCRRRHAGRLRDGGAGQRRTHRGQFKTKRGAVFGDAGHGRRRRR